MKLLSKFLLSLFLSLSLFNCVNKVQDPLTHFTVTQKEKIKPTKWIALDDYGVLKPIETLKYGDDYIIIGETKENVITSINFSTHKFVSGVTFGNGPNELNRIGQLRKVKDKLLINDISLQKIFEIMIIQDSLLQIEPYCEINYNKRLFLFDYLGDNVIATGMFDDYWIGYIDILHNESLSKIDFPKFEETSHLQEMYKSSLYISSHISVSPNGEKIVVATQDMGVISLSDIKENELIEYRKINYFPPSFSVVGGGNQGSGIAKSRDGKVGFCGLDCDDNYIYTL